MLDIGVRNIFDEDHDMFRSTCRKFMQEEVVPYHEEWENNGEVSRELWLKAGQQGLLGVGTKAEDHGVGADFLYSQVVTEEL